MAFTTNTSIEEFDSQTEVTATTPSAVTSGSFSVQADISAYTNSNDAALFNMILVCQFATLPTAGSTIDLFARPINIQSTNDAPTPSANYLHTYLGSFKIDDGGSTSTDMYIPLAGLKFPNINSSQEIEFYIRNNSDQSISSGWSLYLTPLGYNVV